MVGCFVVKDQKIGFIKFGTESGWPLSGLDSNVTQIITSLESLLNCQSHFKFSMGL